MIVLFFIQSCAVWSESKDAEFSLASSDEVVSEYGQSLSAVEATLYSHGIVTCENPALRDVEPMFLANFGNDWDNQADQGHVSPSGHWIGGSGVIVEDFNQDDCWMYMHRVLSETSYFSTRRWNVHGGFEYFFGL